MLKAPKQLAWDSIFEGINQVYRGHREDVLEIIARYVKVSEYMADCVKSIANAISKE